LLLVRAGRGAVDDVSAGLTDAAAGALPMLS